MDKGFVIHALDVILHSFKGLLCVPKLDTLPKMLKVSLVILGVSAVSRLLDLYTLISWQGALLCSLLIALQYLMERRELNALSRVYRNAAVLRDKIKNRSKSTGGSGSGRRVVNNTPTNKQKAGEPAVRRNNDIVHHK